MFSLASLYTYDAGRILLLLLPIWIVITGVTSRNFFAKHKYGLLKIMVAFIVVSAPMIHYAFRHWENFIGRSNFVFVGNQVKQEGNLAPLWTNLKTTALLFTHRAKGNDFFINEPLVDKPVSWLLPIGFAVFLYKILKEKKTAYLFILLWFIFSLLPGVLSLPNGNRTIGAIPTVYFFAAIGLVFLADFAFKFYPKRKVLLSQAIIILFLLFSAFQTYHEYLGPNRREIPGFYPETNVVANYIKTIWDNYDIYLTDNYPRETLTYLLYKKGHDPFDKNYSWLEDRYALPTVARDLNYKGKALFMFAIPENESVAQIILKENPGAERHYLWYINGEIRRKASMVILIPPSVL